MFSPDPDEVYQFFAPLKRSEEVKRQATDFFSTACQYFQLSEEEYSKLKKQKPTVWAFFLYNTQGKEFSPEFVQDWIRFTHATKEDIRKIFISDPDVFSLPIENVSKNVEGIISGFRSAGFTKEKFISGALKNPTLFSRKPESIQQNIYKLVDFFPKTELTYQKYAQACSEYPPLLSLKAETFRRNVLFLSQILEIDQKKCIQLVLAHPRLINHSPSKIKEKLEILTTFFKKGEIKEKTLKEALLKNPSILCANPHSIISKIQRTVQCFKREKLTLKDYLKSAIKQPNLFNLKPETIKDNVYSVVERFKEEGLSVAAYLKCALKDATLFYRSPESSETCIRATAAYFAKDGLTLRNYIEIAKKNGTLFRQAPSTTIQHFEMVKKVMLENRLVSTPHEVWNFLSSNPIVLNYGEENIELRDYVIALMKEQHQKPALSTIAIRKADLLKKLPALTGISSNQVNSLLDEEEKKTKKPLSKKARTEKSIQLFTHLHYTQLKQEIKQSLLNLWLICGNRRDK